MDWKKELVIAALVKQKVAEVDTLGFWQHTLPEVAASEQAVDAVEMCLGESLDSGYRSFLLHANGWRAFHHQIDLFGIDDLLAGPRADRANELSDSLEPLPDLCGCDRSEVMAVAVSSDDIDIMLMTRPHAREPGKVFWLAGRLIDTFPTFEDFFLAMVDYSRLDYQELLQNRTP
jgi:hypothetical protein